jgi:hypothetical protein
MAGQNRSSYEASQARLQQIQQQAALEDEAIKHRALNVDIVQVPDYWYKRTPNVAPKINISVLKLTTPIAKVIDATGECVGTIEWTDAGYKLLFRKDWRGVCDDNAIQKRLDQMQIGA